MVQNRSNWLERLIWEACPYWRGHGNFCLKGRLAGTRDADLCTRYTLKHRCAYNGGLTLTEEQAKEKDAVRTKAWEKAYSGMAADGYMIDPESPWFREAVSELGMAEVAETFRIDQKYLAGISKVAKEE